MPEDSYIQPAHGWTCFHCGVTFHSQGAARDHFGETPAEEPFCFMVRKQSALLLARRARSAERMAEMARLERDRAEERQDSATSQLTELLRLLPGVKSANDVRNAIDVIEGRAITAEAIVAEIERANPELVAAAREAVCQPIPA